MRQCRALPQAMIRDAFDARDLMPLFLDAESASMSVDIPLQMNELHCLKIRFRLNM